MAHGLLRNSATIFDMKRFTFLSAAALLLFFAPALAVRAASGPLVPYQQLATNHFDLSLFPQVRVRLHATQFDDDGDTITITNISGIAGGSIWTNEFSVYKPLKLQSSLEATNIYSFQTLHASGALIFDAAANWSLALGENQQNSYNIGYALVDGPTHDPADTQLRLSTGNGSGAFLLLQNADGFAFRMLNGDELWDDATAHLYLKGGDWNTTNEGETILLIGTPLGWAEIGRFGGPTNVVVQELVINPTDDYMPTRSGTNSFRDSHFHEVVDSTFWELGGTNLVELSRQDAQGRVTVYSPDQVTTIRLSADNSLTGGVISSGILNLYGGGGDLLLFGQQFWPSQNGMKFGDEVTYPIGSLVLGTNYVTNVLYGIYTDDGDQLLRNGVPIAGGTSNYFNYLFVTNLTVYNTSTFKGNVTFETNVTINGLLSVTNLTPNTIVKADSNTNLASVATGTGALTNDGAGNFGWFDLSTLGGGDTIWANNGGLIEPLGTGQVTNVLRFTSGLADNATNEAEVINTATPWLNGGSLLSLKSADTNVFWFTANGNSVSGKHVTYLTGAVPNDTNSTFSLYTTNLTVYNTSTFKGNVTFETNVTINGLLSVTNLTPNTIVKADSNTNLASVATGTGALTNDGAGNFGWFDLGTLSSPQIWANTSGVIEPLGTGQVTNVLRFTSGLADNATNEALVVNTSDPWFNGGSLLSLKSADTNLFWFTAGGNSVSGKHVTYLTGAVPNDTNSTFAWYTANVTSLGDPDNVKSGITIADSDSWNYFAQHYFDDSIPFSGGYAKSSLVLEAQDAAFEYGKWQMNAGNSPSDTNALSYYKESGYRFQIGTNGSVSASGTAYLPSVLITNNIAALLSVGDTTFVDVSKASQTNVVTGAFTILHATNGVVNQNVTHKRYLLAQGDQTLTIPTGWRTNKLQTVPTTLTNGTITTLFLDCIGPTSTAAQQTNILVSFEYH